jgi:hypothetical protein
MDTQQAYERIRAHFDAPGAQLARVGGSGGPGSGTCMYRAYAVSDSTQKCAVGALIPDEAYDSRMEGSSLCESWLAKWPFIDGLLHDVDKRFLRSAQLLHDSVAADAGTFVTGLDLLAVAYGLKPPGSRYSTVAEDEYLGC